METPTVDRRHAAAHRRELDILFPTAGPITWKDPTVTTDLPPQPWRGRKPTAAEVYRYLLTHPHNEAVIDWWQRTYDRMVKA